MSLTPVCSYFQIYEFISKTQLKGIHTSRNKFFEVHKIRSRHGKYTDVEFFKAVNINASYI